MNQQTPLYDLKILEAYLRQRQNGQYVEAYEQALAKDDFLQTLMIGMESQLSENPDLSALIEEKKKQGWEKLVPLLPPVAAMSPTQNPIVRLGQKYQQIWGELQFSRFHYLFGFNCSCVLAILVFCLWIHYGSEQPELLSYVAFPEGFKP